MQDFTLISIVGPTAVGKTALSIALAQRLGCELISCDSRQFYRHMDIGTAKASAEELASVKHHFIDMLDPNQTYDAAKFEAAALELIAEKREKMSCLVMVGGSTLYAHALWHGIDEMPEVPPQIRCELNQLFERQGLQPLLEELQRVDLASFQTIDRQNHVRIIRALEVYRSSGKPISEWRKKTMPLRPFRQIKCLLDMDRAALYARINERVDKMMEQGLVEEVRALLSKGYSPDLPALQAIGYAEIVAYLQGKTNLQTAVELIKQHSRNYAKRQLTFFRREPDILHLEASRATEALAAHCLDLLRHHDHFLPNVEG